MGEVAEGLITYELLLHMVVCGGRADCSNSCVQRLGTLASTSSITAAMSSGRASLGGTGYRLMLPGGAAAVQKVALTAARPPPAGRRGEP